MRMTSAITCWPSCSCVISRYISTAQAAAEIDLVSVHADLVAIEARIRTATQAHNAFLRELGLPELPGGH
jgi:type I restriction enzyme M protein